jgi:CTP synthase (UTP-ammonia lyase)
VSTPVRIAIIGDYNPEYVSHATNAPAVEHAAGSVDVPIEVEWVGTEAIDPTDPAAALRDWDGFWIAAGSPYRNRAGALAAIRFAREEGRPILATCGGFQYGLLEFAHNVLGRTELEHEEDFPVAEHLLISAVACPVPDRAADAPKLVGSLPIHIREDSRAREIFQADRIEEEYNCSFELNPEYDELFEEHGLEFTGFGDRGDSRIFEVPGHPFYLATLFQPQRKSKPGTPHPLAVAFVKAAARERARREETVSS